MHQTAKIHPRDYERGYTNDLYDLDPEERGLLALDDDVPDPSRESIFAASRIEVGDHLIFTIDGQKAQCNCLGVVINVRHFDPCGPGEFHQFDELEILALRFFPLGGADNTDRPIETRSSRGQFSWTRRELAQAGVVNLSEYVKGGCTLRPFC